MLSAYHIRFGALQPLDEGQDLNWPGMAPMLDDRRASTVSFVSSRI